MFSIAFSFANLVGQLILLWIEAQIAHMGLLDYYVKSLTDASTNSVPLLEDIDPLDNQSHHEKVVDYTSITDFRFDERNIVPLKDILNDIQDEQT